MKLMSRTLIAVAALLIATPALAAPVTLKANPVDTDGQVTLGDIFDGAGASSSVVVARRSGPSVVMEAGQLQSLARQSGLEWDNPRGLRRVVIRNASLSPSAATPAAIPGTTAPAPAVYAAPQRPVHAERVATTSSRSSTSSALSASPSVAGRPPMPPRVSPFPS